MTTPVSATSAPGAPTPAAKPDVKQVAQQFEAVFLRQMIGSMRQAGLSDGLFDSSAQDQFRDMADARLADSMAGIGTQGARDGFGIADLLARQLGGGEPASK